MLDAHPEVVCSGEGHFLLEVAAPVAKMIQAYNAKLKYVADLVYEGDATYAAVTETETIEWTRSFIEARMAKRANPGVKALGDKTPNYTKNLSDLNYLFPTCQIFYILRDPRDVVVSTMYHGKRSGFDDSLKPGSRDHSQVVSTATDNWVAGVMAVDKFQAQFPKRVVEVRYEDLLADPMPSLKRLASRLGVSGDDAVLAEVIRSTSFEATTGRKRGVQDQTSFNRKGIAGDWQTELDQQTLAIIEEKCGALMRNRGYI